MKLGVSTYSLSRAIRSGELSTLSVLDKIKEMGGEHAEIVPIGFSLTEDPELIEQIKERAAALDLELSNYAIGANFITEDEASYRQEIERVKAEVDIAHQLGVKLMRHDVASRKETSIVQFYQDLPKLADACREIADYAAQYGITTSVENHGFYVQAHERVQMLVHTVGRDNYKTTLDIGNFMCVDEDPVVAVKQNLPLASMVHIKDFYKRPSYENPGAGWFNTAHGNYLRGAIAGQGDINMREVLRIIKQSGYDGYLSIEFEGMEECQLGTKTGLDNIRRLWDEC